jgi:hypothetical protein
MPTATSPSRSISGAQDQEATLCFIPYEQWRASYLRGVHDANKPVQWSIAPDRSLVVGPKPDQAYMIRGEYQRGPQILAADSDIPIMPDQYHDAITWRACMMLAAHDEAPAAYQSAAMKYHPTSTIWDAIFCRPSRPAETRSADATDIRLLPAGRGAGPHHPGYRPEAGLGVIGALNYESQPTATAASMDMSASTGSPARRTRNMGTRLHPRQQPVTAGDTIVGQSSGAPARCWQNGVVTSGTYGSVAMLRDMSASAPSPGRSSTAKSSADRRAASRSKMEPTFS